MEEKKYVISFAGGFFIEHDEISVVTARVYKESGLPKEVITRDGLVLTLDLGILSYIGPGKKMEMMRAVANIIQVVER